MMMISRYEKSLRGFLQFIEGKDETEDLEKEKKLEGESESANVTSNQTDTKQWDSLIQEFIHSQVYECYCIYAISMHVHTLVLFSLQIIHLDPR